jgi:hypothetical protein
MEKAFFDYLYFKVIHSTENKIIELLQRKKIPFMTLLDQDNQLIINILISDNISIINQTFETTLQQILNELAEQTYSEIEKRIQEDYQGITFTKIELVPLIIKIIKSKYNTVLCKNKELLAPNKNRNSQYPKSFIEYHFQEYIVSLVCDVREQTSKEKIEHQIRRQIFIREHYNSNNFASMGKKLSDISSNYAENLIKNPHKSEQCVRNFIRNAEHLNNHICYVLSHPSFFSKNELTSLNLLQQNILAVIKQTKIA